MIRDFGNLPLREVASLKLDRLNLSSYARSNPSGATRKYCDNVVAAMSCVGPMATR